MRASLEQKNFTSTKENRDVIPSVADATAVVGLGLTAETADADIFPSDTATESHNKFTFNEQ